MKNCLAVTLWLLLASVVSAQDSAGNQIKVDDMNEKLRTQQIHNVDGTPKPNGRMVNVAEVIKKTNELNTLVRSVNGDVAGLNKGMLAVDLTQKLKKIEKLAKDLRHDLE